MANNGVSGSMKLIQWTVGIVAFLITLYTVFHAPLVKAIATEVEARQAGDNQLFKDVSGKLDIIINQNADTKNLLSTTLTKVDINTNRIGKLEDRIYK